MLRIQKICFICFLLANCGGSVSGFEDDAAQDPEGVDVIEDPATDSNAEADSAPDIAHDTLPDAVVEPGPDSGPDLQPDTTVDPEPDFVPDIDPDLCIAEGCILPSDGIIPCCPGLSPHNDCLPGDPICQIDVLLCINCGNGSCDPHETPWNCPGDCPAACEIGSESNYSCGGLENWQCSCIEDPCKPRCTVSPPLWYDPCTGASLGACLPGMGVAQCVDIGTDSEGWYDITFDYFITNAVCEPRWNCYFDW